ncbi:hypothetical protein H0J56_002896 [Salmonella enterica]|nr:hypothetical protein [Salmonella enterica]
MKEIKSQGNGEQPAISRRNFIQASSALLRYRLSLRQLRLRSAWQR